MASRIPEDRRLVASIAAQESWARTEDRTDRTSKASAAMDAKFLAEVGGDPMRAEHLHKAYFQRLALKLAQARRARKEGAAA